MANRPPTDQEPSPRMSALTTVLLVIHLMVAAALVGVVLLQRSEGGALGIGGGGGGFLTGRGTANLLTRVTAALAAAFFATSLLLTISGPRSTGGPSSVIDKAATSGTASNTSAPSTPAAPASADQPAPPSGGILDKLK
jgi:preprotein translocase subunit SecG